VEVDIGLLERETLVRKYRSVFWFRKEREGRRKGFGEGRPRRVRDMRWGRMSEERET